MNAITKMACGEKDTLDFCGRIHERAIPHISELISLLTKEVAQDLDKLSLSFFVTAINLRNNGTITGTRASRAMNLWAESLDATTKAEEIKKKREALNVLNVDSPEIGVSSAHQVAKTNQRTQAVATP